MKILVRALFSLIYTYSIQLLPSIKLSCLVGTRFAFFSLNQCLVPALGFFLTTQAALLSWVFQAGLHFLFPSFGLTVSMYHLPTLGGTLYLSLKNRLCKFLIPLVCITLFIIHPVGSTSAYYTVYWLLPICLSIFSTRSIFLQSLAATLTTHAIGTVIWLYTHPTSPAAWNSLFQIVWMERLTFALLMTCAYYGILLMRTCGNSLLLKLSHVSTLPAQPSTPVSYE